MSSKRKNSTNEIKFGHVTKKLQCELQATIAFACFDSDEVLRAGKSANNKMLMQIMSKLYFPSPNKDDNRISYTHLFLTGAQRFKALFEFAKKEDDPVHNNYLVLPDQLHCQNNCVFAVDNSCISMSLLTRKNLTKPTDISGGTMLSHAKKDAANCTQALKFCLEEDSPYKNFDGTFPSGTNYFHYLEWI